MILLSTYEMDLLIAIVVVVSWLCKLGLLLLALDVQTVGVQYWMHTTIKAIQFIINFNTEIK